MLLHYGNIELAADNNSSDWNEIVDWCNQNGFEGIENVSQLNQFAHRAERLLDDVAERDRPDFKQIRATAILSGWSNQTASAIYRVDSSTYNTPNTDQLFKIQLPTLLLWGKYDFVCPPELADDIENNIGSSDVEKVIYSRSGHSPMANEAIKFWSDLVEWIRTH
jgi:pimeloyl-ACP methyl ester carboxylesterase